MISIIYPYLILVLMLVTSAHLSETDFIEQASSQVSGYWRKLMNSPTPHARGLEKSTTGRAPFASCKLLYNPI